MESIFALEWWIQIAIILMLIVLARWAMGPLWAGWQAWQIWRVEMAARWIDIERQRADLALVRPDPLTGLLPVDRAAIEVSTEPILALALARIETMRLPANVPQSIHYAPHYARIEEQRPSLPMVETPTAKVLPLSVPSVAECYRRGYFDDPKRLHIAFDQEMNPIFSPIEKTYGVAVAGVPGMGKTTGMQYWVLQMAHHGAQVAVIDPAANSSSQQGLAVDMGGFRSRLWSPPASDPDEIVKLLARVEAMGLARNRGQDASTWSLMLMVDEMTSLVTGERGDEIAAMIKRIARQYRKEHIYTIAAGQDWLGDALGEDVGLRRAFVCKAVYRVDPDNARKLMIRKPLIDMVPTLQSGQMIWVDQGMNQTLVAVPRCTAADVAAILGNSAAPGSTSHTGKELLPALPLEVTGKYDGSDPEVGSEVEGEAVIDAGKLRQIRDYGAQDWSTHKIVGVVFGVKGGRAYNSARELVNQILGREL